MPPLLLALVVLASAIHVAWNAVARSIGGRASFAWLTAVIGVVVLAPLFVWQRLHDPGTLDARALWLATLSGVIEAAYFLLLQASYVRAELSLVYPLSRGVAPLLALLPARFWAGESVGARELAGIGVVVAGATLLARSQGSAAKSAGMSRARGVEFALLTGGAIAAYQLVDGVALRGAAAPRPLEYLFLMQVVLAVLLTIAFALRGGFTPALFSETRVVAGRLLAAGVAIQAAYLLILFALRDGKIPLVIAARNSGIPLSLLAGRFLLKERISPRRLLAASLIVAGVVLFIKW